jgi:hypothetical protein
MLGQTKLKTNALREQEEDWIEPFDSPVLRLTLTQRQPNPNPDASDPVFMIDPLEASDCKYDAFDFYDSLFKGSGG